MILSGGGRKRARGWSHRSVHAVMPSHWRSLRRRTMRAYVGGAAIRFFGRESAATLGHPFNFDGVSAIWGEKSGNIFIVFLPQRVFAGRVAFCHAPRFTGRSRPNWVAVGEHAMFRDGEIFELVLQISR